MSEFQYFVEPLWYNNQVTLKVNVSFHDQLLPQYLGMYCTAYLNSQQYTLHRMFKCIGTVGYTVC